MIDRENDSMKMVSFMIPQHVLDRVDRLAKKADIPRSKLLRNFVEVWSEAMEQSNKIGLWSFGVLMRDFKDICVSWVVSLKEGDINPGDVGNCGEWEKRPWVKDSK